MLSEKPLKIPLFSMASGRDAVDELLGVSIEQLTKQVPFRHIPHRHDFYHLFWVESGNGAFEASFGGPAFDQSRRKPQREGLRHSIDGVEPTKVTPVGLTRETSLLSAT
jgi:hypothetical protein